MKGAVADPLLMSSIAIPIDPFPDTVMAAVKMPPFVCSAAEKFASHWTLLPLPSHLSGAAGVSVGTEAPCKASCSARQAGKMKSTTNINSRDLGGTSRVIHLKAQPAMRGSGPPSPKGLFARGPEGSEVSCRAAESGKNFVKRRSSELLPVEAKPRQRPSS